MYADIIRKKVKEAGTKSKPFVNYLAYVIAGSVGLGCVGWTYFNREVPSNAGLEKLKNHWFMKRAIEHALTKELFYFSPQIIEDAKKRREATEKVYEVYQQTHENLQEKQE